MRLALLLLAAIPHLAAAQQPAPCAGPEHRQFDFWIGDWDVTGTRGQKAGTNRIERVLGGCVLYESWTGAGPSRGHSFNIFDPGDNKWHQTWVDNSGTLLHISGGIVNGPSDPMSALAPLGRSVPGPAAPAPAPTHFARRRPRELEHHPAKGRRTGKWA